MLHEWLRTWFQWVEIWGYWGIFVLMAMESSIIPVPSEIVMPPAAFWAAQGRFSFAGVVLAGAAGSYFGSVVSYWVSRWIGGAFLTRYGKRLGVSAEKLIFAESWIQQFGTFGVFVARLLPVVRHLISIPAGFLKMSFSAFSMATFLGAGLWCFVLAWLGQEVIGSNPEILQSPEALMGVIKVKMHWFLAGVFLFAALYGVMLTLKKRLSKPDFSF
jgi:membrane protein DedA with SNARE-associated domain